MVNYHNHLSSSISTIHSFIDCQENNWRMQEVFDKMLRQLCFAALDTLEDENIDTALEVYEAVRDYAFDDALSFKAQSYLERAHEKKDDMSLQEYYDEIDFYSEISE